jgi:ubiquinone/menaquinone biosynthesis C-methylase UbiE
MSSYDEIAEWYDQSVRTGSLLHELVEPALFALLGNVSGKHICDLACGQGVIARKLAHRGASVVGVDISAKLLEIARREEQAEPLGIAYMQDDAQTLSKLRDAEFDSVVCNMSLMDIPDIQATFQQVQRILRSSGVFVCSIVHPCYPPRRIAKDGTVQSYFNEGFWQSDNLNGVRGKVGAYHHTLSTYLNNLVGAGLLLQRIVEPQATGRLAERVPRHREVPTVMVMVCGKV